MEYLFVGCGLIFGFGVGFYVGYKYGQYDANQEFLSRFLGVTKAKKTYDVKIMNK